MINPNEITTVRVGQLAPADFSATDLIPHEVGTDLKSGTIQQLSDFIALQIGASSGVAFRAITVLDGETLPNTTQEEWILVGKGTFYNVNGGATILTTEELNALMSNGSYWFIGVEIPINADLIGITQFIRPGYTQTTPSENAVFEALLLKSGLSVPNVHFIADGVANSFDIGVNAEVRAVFWNGALLNDLDVSQIGSIFTLTFIPANGDLIKPI